MLKAKTVAVYLIHNKIVSNHKLREWIDGLFFSDEIVKNNVLIYDQFFYKVRILREKNIISEKTSNFLLKISIWKQDAIDLYRKIIDSKVSIISINDINYPDSLRNINDSPYIIFARGDLGILNNPTITIVGTRNNSKYAEEKTKQLVSESIACGMVTVSGFARGIDTIVSQQTLNMNGYTVAILPELIMNKTNHTKVLEISEYISNQNIAVSKWQYVARNRIAAALAPYTVVVEAPIRSGTLITAELALMYDRDVYVVLPNVFSFESYGGISFMQSRIEPKFINSLYDIFFDKDDWDNIVRYYFFINSCSLGYIDIRENEYRNLNDVDLRKYILDGAGGSLEEFSRRVVKLLRLGVILERKNKIVFNFSGNKKWQKT